MQHECVSLANPIYPTAVGSPDFLTCTFFVYTPNILIFIFMCNMTHDIKVGRS